jgi:hypothetical protein
MKTSNSKTEEEVVEEVMILIMEVVQEDLVSVLVVVE